MAATDRRAHILGVAVDMARRYGVRNLRRDALAEQAKCSTGLIHVYFSTMTQLRRAIMREAIEREILEIVAEGLALQDKQAHKAPDELKKKALASLTR